MSQVNKAVTQVDNRTGREAAMAVDTKQASILEAILGAKPKGGSKAGYRSWVGKVSLVQSSAPKVASFIGATSKKRGHRVIIQELAKLIQKGNGSHTFANVGAVEHFDQTEVYVAGSFKSPNNARIGDGNWGGQLLGQVAYEDVAATDWCQANGFKDNMFPIFKVTR
jgi:hypothetical protein